MSRKRAAIVSSYQVTCGIAYNAERVEHHLKPYYDVDVLAVDMELTRNTHPQHLRKAADRHIAEIAAKLSEYDLVNIQLEGGVFGKVDQDIWPRICALLEAARGHVILSMHSAPFPAEINRSLVIKSLRKYLVFAPFFLLHNILERRACRRFWDLARRMSQRGQLTMLVFNPLERTRIGHCQQIPRIADHPLCYFSQAEREAIRNAARGRYRALLKLQPDDVMLGVYGFIMPYKGFADAIRALPHLPEHYKLVIFGGANIAGIQPRTECDPHVAALTELVKALKLESRVIFCGRLTDDEICQATAEADIVLLPYLAVNHPASGPATLAIELADKIIASDTYTFNRYLDYYPGRLRRYDSGNSVQLAQLILELQQEPKRPVPYLEPNIDTQTRLYRELWEGPHA